jgi:hypothetical protein
MPQNCMLLRALLPVAVIIGLGLLYLALGPLRW